MTRWQMDSLPASLGSQLRALERRIKNLSFIKGTGKGLLLTTLVLGTCLALDWSFGLPSTFRLLLLIATAVTVAYAVVRYLVWPLCSRSTPVEMAAIVETVHPGLNERLSSTVELLDPHVPELHKGSALMRNKLTSQTVEQVRNVDFRKSVNSGSARRWALIGLAAVILLLSPFSFARDGYTLLWARLINPWGNYDQAANLFFEVEPGDTVIPRGSDVLISARAKFRFGEEELPQNVSLRWVTEAGRLTTRRMQFVESKGVYEVLIPSVLQTLTYQVLADSYETRSYQIRAVDPPIVESVGLQIVPPSYTGQPERSVDAAVGMIDVFERSDVHLTVFFNKPADAAEIVWYRTRVTPVEGVAETAADAATPPLAETETIEVTEVEPLPLSDDRMTASIRFWATESGRFEVRFTDQDGLSSHDQTYRHLRITPDLAPEVSFELDRRPATFRATDVLPAAIIATDDVGLGLVELLVDGETVDGTRRLSQLRVEESKLGTSQVHEPFRVDFSRLDLTDVVAVVIRGHAADERAVPGPQEAWTDEWRLTLDAEAPPAATEDVEQRQQSWREVLEEIRRDVELAREDTGILQREASDDARQQVDFRRDADLRRLVEIETDDVVRLEQVATGLASHPLYSNLTPEIRDIARDPLMSALRETQAALDGGTSEKPAHLEIAHAELNAAYDRLTALLEQFEEIAELEQRLAEIDRLAERADQLAEDFEEYQEQREELASLPEDSLERQPLQEELAAEHERMQQQQNELATDLENLLEEAPELLDAARAFQRDRLEEFAEQAQQLAEQEDLLAEALHEEALNAADAMEPLTRRQQEIIDEAQEIAALTEQNQAETPVDPLDLDELREALAALEAGDLAQAVNEQEEAADELDRLAEALRMNESLPDDPQAAAQELAERENQLRQEMAELRQEIAANPVAEGQQPEPTAEQTEQLEELAAEQAAIMAAAAQLDVPQNAENQQRQVVQRAADALEQLMQGEPERAEQSAQQTQDALAQLAEQIGTEEQRAERAANQMQNLRNQQRGLADELENINRQLAEGNENAVTPERMEQIQDLQEQIARQVAEMDAPGVDAEQRDAVQELAEALVELEQENLQEAADDAREAEQALADLHHQLRAEPTADEAVAEIAEAEDNVMEQAATALAGGNADQLRELANQQRQLGDQLRQVDAPLARDIQPEAQQAFHQAAAALQRAADQIDNEAMQEAAEQALEEAEHQLARVEERLNLEPGEPMVAGEPEIAPAEQAAQLAEAQVAAAQESQAQAAATEVPESNDLADQMQALQDRQDAVADLPTTPATAQAARDAETALAEAAAAQRQVNQQASREQPQADAEAQPPSEQLAQAMQQNAEAQSAAAEALQELAEAMQSPEAVAEMEAADQQFAQAAEALLAPDVGELQQTASEALALAEQQAELAALAEDLLENDVLDAEQVNQNIRDLEQQQRQMVQQIDQLLREAAPIARATAEQAARDAQQALNEQDLPLAAEMLADAAQALEDMAAQTENLVAATAETPLIPEPPAEAEPAVDEPPSPGEPIAQQAEALAEQQRELAQELAEMLQGAPAQLASNEPMAPAPESTPMTPINAGQPEGADQPEGDESPMENAEPALTPADAVAAQQALAEQAAQQAMNVAETAGAESPEFEAAMEFAEDAAEALQAAQSGTLNQAAAQAQQAAEQGQAAASQLEASPLSDAAPELADAAGELAQQQQQLAEAFQQMAQDPAMRNQAIAQGQAQTQAATQDLAEAIGQAAEELGSAPLNNSDQAQMAQQASQTAQQASQSGQQANQAIGQQNLEQASQSAAQAAETLRQVAEAAQQAAEMTGQLLPESIPVPPSFGEPVARAAQQLNQAQQQLAEASPDAPLMPEGDPQALAQSEAGMPQDATGQPMPAEGTPPSGQPQPAPAGTPMNNPFQPVAQALAQAAEQLALEQAQNQPPMQQDPQGSMQASQFSDGGGTTQVPTLVELEMRLERMAQREWGRLPGELETEILQASQRRMDGEYGDLIREYFRELSNQQVETP